MVKLLKSLAVIFILVLMVTGCSSKSSNYELPPPREEGQQVELILWETYNNKEHEVLKQVVKMFEDVYPDIKISIERVPRGGHWSRIVTSLATSQTPDIARIDLSHLATLADRGAIVDMGLLGVEEIKDQYENTAIKSNVFKSKTWGLPDTVNTSVLFYNKDLFNDAGIDFPNSDWTWDNLIEAASKLTNIDIGVYGFAGENSFWGTIPYFGSYGASILNEKGTKLSLDSQDAVEALEMKLSLTRDHKIAADTWSEEALSVEEGFIGQKYAMVIADSGNMDKFIASDINFGVSLIPQGPNGTGSNFSGTSMVIFRGSEHPREAYEFIKFLTSPGIQDFWSYELGTIPVNKEAYDLVDTYEHPHIEVLIEQIKHSIAAPVLVNFSRVEEIYNTEMELAYKGIKTIEQALKDAVKQINEDPEIFRKK